MAERIGESTLLGKSLLALILTALRRHDVEGVRALLPRVLAAADVMGSAEFLAGARACQAWLAWQDGRRDDVLSLAGEFGALMAPRQDPWAYYGLVHLWPLVAAHLDASDVAPAIAAARDLPQHAPPLPADLRQLLTAAATAWDSAQPSLAADHLTHAPTQARTLNYP